MVSIINFIKSKILKQETISIIAMWLIVIVGVFLRTHNADNFPVSNNDDGLIYTWAGASQLNDPTNFVSLTIFDQGNESLIWRSQYKNFIPHQEFGMKITRPWFDHPPLGVLIIGTIPHLLGYDNIEQMPHMIVRFSAILASIFTMILTFELAKKLFNKKAAFLSLAFMATIPYFVFAQRQAYLENFMNPIFLASLILIIKYFDSKKTKYFVGSLLAALFLGWMKIIGFAIPFMLAGWLLKNKKTKEGIITIGANIVSIASYAAYGLLINKQAFLQLLSSQGERGAFVSSFYKAMTSIEIYQSFDSGWYVLGLVLSIALMVGVIKNKKEEKGRELFSWFFITWLIILFILSGRYNNSPWYRYPLIPFMSIAIGYFTAAAIKTKDLFKAGILFLLGLTGLDLISVEMNSTMVRLITLGYFGALASHYIFDNKITKLLADLVIKLFIIFLIALNIFVVFKYYSTTYCNEDVHCLTPTKIILNE
jgi:4-amino-4-deoxy-L-arabinose transferase-like glycosyltransferase